MDLSQEVIATGVKTFGLELPDPVRPATAARQKVATGQKAGGSPGINK
jgi:hypothetical protein